MADALNMAILTSPDCKAYQSRSPRKDIDHILVSQHFSVKDARQSDHQPLETVLAM